MGKVVLAVLCLCCVAALSEAAAVQRPKINRPGGIVFKNAVTGKGNENELDKEDKGDIFDINADTDLIDGDVIPPTSRNTLVDEGRHWPSTRIPVVMGSNLGLEAIAVILEARQEYEMRTCLTFPDRTDEKDYIEYQSLSGCYSSVGMVGGPQTISIGPGCEKMAVAEHETMHAIGIYHEQSRTDRDHYVRIALENVDEGKEHNFNSYPYSVVDDRRVRYDYDSVMHYGDTSFSSNGQPTIVTLDPAFQDVIGQRRTFSEGDVTKINRMYKCGDTLRYSYNCNYEDETVCGYVQDFTDSGDWVRHIVGASPSVPVTGVLPTTDGSTGVAGEGSYMLLDTSAATSSMYSMKYKSTVAQQCLEVSYYMDLQTGSTASLELAIATIDPVNGDVLSVGSPVTTLSGDHEGLWMTERVTISAPSEYKLAIIGNGHNIAGDVIAIDDVSVLDKPCEMTYFVVNDYSQILATSARGDYFYSPLMYTDDGYGFQVKIYPVGSSNSKDGYMAMYYYVAQGVNDDSLQWPMYNRYIKFSIVDQGPDALTRMTQANSILSSSSGGSWDKPTSTRNSGYGFSSFMSVSDIQNTRHFLKHDQLMVSMQVTDMTSWTTRSAPNVASYSEEEKTIDDVMERPKCAETEMNNDELNQTAAIAIVSLTTASVFVIMSLVMMYIFWSRSSELSKVMKGFRRSHTEK
uniref:meprin A subunit alpha-like isoform X1 n=2 Tax=Ciona intestinalis TaxID=7719 RepID=UPI000180D121|nr:meprin A subunit alpha-like isoform X1 [Ciona intestinalis]|eukprot:XP_002123301.1 meprin A subunit alpha-like isoform X1 [Ciona intestinalis]